MAIVKPELRRAAYISPGADLAAATELARRVDELDYDSVWVTHGLGRDSFLVLAAYGAATTHIGLGNGVVPIYPRHPVAMAQAALSLSEMTRGRFRLGIGISHQASMESMLGLELKQPLTVMREYVAVLRGALGEGASFTGEHYRAQWSLTLPRRPPAPPIYLAALSQKMLELAGEIADGVILWLCAPAYIREVAIPALTRGRQRTGKTLESFEIVAAVPAALTLDPLAARSAFRGELARYLTLPFYRTMLKASGFGDALHTFDTTGRTPDILMDALGAIGDEATGRAFVEAHRAAGVTLPAVRPITFPDAAWYRPTLEAGAGW